MFFEVICVAYTLMNSVQYTLRVDYNVQLNYDVFYIVKFLILYSKYFDFFRILGKNIDKFVIKKEKIY